MPQTSSPVPDAMTRIVVQGGSGGADALRPGTTATPRPGPGQVLIRVAAAGVNRPDILQRQGRYPPPQGAPDTLGLEVAGEIAALGEGEGRWRVGDKVAALLGGGGYAEYAVADAGCCLPAPGGLDLIETASLPETAFTVFSNVFERGGLKAGETLLVHGATSGIGVMAIQMAKAAGARVIATGRGADKAEAATGLGADISIDATAEDFIEAVRDAGGADVILDMVGREYLQKNLQALNPDGRLCIIAFLSGSKVEVDLASLLPKRLTITASTLRARPAAEKARLARAVEATVWPWVEAGEVRAHVDRVFPLKDAAAAHAWLEAGEHVGKVMLRVG